jgi:hypothetical protein
MHRKLILLTFLLLFSCATDNNIPNYLIVEPSNKIELAKRGKYLFEISSCGSCHSLQGLKNSPLLGGGQKALDSSGVVAPHLGAQFSDANQWNTETYFNFFRRNYYPSGKRVVEGEHDGYEWLSDEDLLSLAAYLSTLGDRKEPQFVEDTHNNQTNSFNFGFGEVFGGGKEIFGYVPNINPKNTRAYGKYLADSVVRCNVCHAAKEKMFHTEEYLEGGHVFTNQGAEFVIPPLGLRPDAYENSEGSFIYWSESDMHKFLSLGVKVDGEKVDSSLCPTEFFSSLNKNDRQALINFYKSLTQP